MFGAAGKGELGALLVVGANPVAELAVEPSALKNTFVIVQDIFLTETAALADVVLPAASLYEKTGTVTNTFGDVQLTKKAADRAGVKPDFEILVRLAGGMGVDVKALVPFGKGAVTADLGQSRGAQSGEADRHSVWLAANNLEPKLSPFDPMAVFDEIVRLVPGYSVDRLNLFGGNDVRTEPGFVPVAALTQSNPAPIVPAARWIVYLGNAGQLQQRAQGTRRASGTRIGGDRGGLDGLTRLVFNKMSKEQLRVFRLGCRDGSQEKASDDSAILSCGACSKWPW